MKPTGNKAATIKRGESLDNNIKALRTIIQMLADLQKKNHNQAVNAQETDSRTPITEEASKELKILSALATVLVMTHEIVAVVAKHGNLGGLEVIASTDSVVSVAEPIPNSNILGRIWKLVVTANPRLDSSPTLMDGPEVYPTIHNSKNNLNHLGGVELGVLKAAAKKEW